MIEVTDEMVAAYVEAWKSRLFKPPQDTDRPAVREGLAAVLALVERDYVVERRCKHGSDPRRCGPCSFDRAIPRSTPPQ